jgi:hypothetical protein
MYSLHKPTDFEVTPPRQFLRHNTTRRWVALPVPFDTTQRGGVGPSSLVQPLLIPAFRHDTTRGGLASPCRCILIGHGRDVVENEGVVVVGAKSHCRWYYQHSLVAAPGLQSTASLRNLIGIVVSQHVRFMQFLE